LIASLAIPFCIYPVINLFQIPGHDISSRQAIKHRLCSINL
jgi:hypothetical protein